MLSALDRLMPTSDLDVSVEPSRLRTTLRAPAKLLETPGPTPSAERAGPAPDRAPVAVIVAHGMGQQVRFETLTTMASRLAEVAGAWPPARARLVDLGGERLARVEIEVSTCKGVREVHLYETYWAPFTEGAVTLRDVLRFLVLAGGNGIRTAARGFRRWLFGEYRDRDVPILTLVSLLAGVALVLALMAINGAIGLVVAARLALPGATWPTAGLIADLSTVFNVLLVTAGAFGASLWVGRGARGRPGRRAARTIVALVSLVFLLVMIATTVAAAVAVVALLALHQRAGLRPPLLRELLGPAIVDALNGAVELGAGVVVGALALGVAWKLGRALVRPRGVDAAGTPRQGPALPRRTILALLGVLGAGVVAEAVLFLVAGWHLAPATPDSTPMLRTLSWLLVVAGAWLVRATLVEYVGDVAVYVQPYVLDRFNDLRAKIRASVANTVAAVYRATTPDGRLEYGRVILVGHSLGSVVLYDALNQMLADDELARANLDHGSADTVARTALFLTLGSPLDKTAFVFDSEPCASETRAALAATSRPLVEDRAVRRFDWVNVHSPWDLISGPLDEYDPPAASTGNGFKRVQNVVDPEASTLLLAHVEYWESARLYDLVLGHIA
jgi:hypothetical protein